MGLGLQGAYGIESGFDALGQIIAQRKKDELLAQAEIDKQRQLAIQEAQNAETAKWRELQFTGLENQRQQMNKDREDAAKARADTAAQAAADRQEGIIRANLGTTPMGFTGATGLNVLDAQKIGLGNLFTPNKIDPANPDAPQTFTFAGTAQQQAKAKEDADRIAAAREQARLVASLRQPKADALTQINTVDDAGNPVVKIVPKVAGASYPAAPTSAERSQAHELPQVKDVVQDLDTLSQGINTQEGLPQWYTGLKRQAAAGVNQDDAAASYLNVKQAWTLTLARLQAQQRISNQEMINAKSLAPELTDPKKVRDDKIARLWKFYNAKVSALPPGGRATAGGNDTSPAPNAATPDPTDPYGALHLFSQP